MKIKKIDIIFLILSVFLQNFAIIKTNSFGIAFSTIFLIYLFIKYKIYKNINKKNIIHILEILLFLLIVSIINNSYNINQILRLLMIIGDAYVSYLFIKSFNKKDKEYFALLFKYFYIFWCFYGLYDFIAQVYHLPLFLNIFSNNPSYGVRNIFSVYSGWSNTPRIYTTFFEPSVYSIFIIYSYFFLMINCKNKRDKYILTFLFLINLIFTFARTGYLCILIFILVFIFEKILKKINNKMLLILLKSLIILIPFFSYIGMLLLNNTVFNDNSINIRSASASYYLSESIDSIQSILIGHGVGTLNAGDNGVIYNCVVVENFAHNGYIEFIYQFGYIGIIILIYALVCLIEKCTNNFKLYAYLCTFTICISGSLYNVETMTVLLSMILAFSIKKEAIK